MVAILRQQRAPFSGMYYVNALVAACLISCVTARVVNISNTWMLPEEGFPVFYRHFRDRISWYEADAVCQFHHANLVTADSSSQYDAIRAYLKELDITDNIWIGLTKTSDKPNFTWTDFRPLSGDGHWQEAIPKGNEPLCVAMDPAADFLWKARPCGGPEVASFICELPIPIWASGPKGCLLTELPSLTVLYIPEQSAVELTSDCGLDGTKRIACKGNADREELMKQLTCTIEDFDDHPKASVSPSFTSDLTTSSEDNSIMASKTTKPWIWTSNTVDIDYGMPTRHRRETDDTLSPLSTRSAGDLSTKATLFDKSTSVTPASRQTNDGDGGKRVVTTKDSNIVEETFVTVTTDGKLADSSTSNKIPAGEEFPSAINQGQLFSIIENGTMFDTLDQMMVLWNESKLLEDHNHAPRFKQQKQQLLQDKNTNPPLLSTTTIAYNKESPSVDKIITNKSIKEKSTNKKDKLKYSDPKNANFLPKLKKMKTVINKDVQQENINKELVKNKQDVTKLVKKDLEEKNNFAALENETFSLELSSKSPVDKEENKFNTNNEERLIKKVETNLNKEVPIIPIVSNESPILNRTFRKQLPTYIGENNVVATKTTLQTIFSNPTIQMSKDNLQIHSTVIPVKTNEEIDLSKSITTMTSLLDEEKKVIDPKLDELNKNVQTNKDSEIITKLPPTITIPPRIIRLEKLETFDMSSEESNHGMRMVTKEEYLPKSFLEESTESPKIESGTTATTITGIVSSKPTGSKNEEEMESEAPPRPNRQRQLTRPQRKQFYPYFFSRVLG